MRWWTLPLALTLAGCTLLVSTDGLRDAPSPPDAATPVDAATTAPEASTPSQEASVDLTPTSELPGLVGAWLFDDGTANDSSGRSHHGVLSGNATVGADPTRGKVLLLDGGAMEVSALGGAAFPHSGTVSLWFRWTEMAQADTQILFDGWDKSRRHLMLRHANDAPIGEIQFALQQRAAPYVAEGYAVTPRNEWQHLVITWDAEKRSGTLYQNGALVSRDSYDGDFVPDEQEVVVGLFLRGAIDDVRLFDRPLSEEEAKKLP